MLYLRQTLLRVDVACRPSSINKVVTNVVVNQVSCHYSICILSPLCAGGCASAQITYLVYERLLQRLLSKTA